MKHTTLNNCPSIFRFGRLGAAASIFCLMSLLPAVVAQGQDTYTYGSFAPWNAPQPTTTAYIAPRTDGQPGSGIPSDPFDASSSAKFDALIQRFSSNTAIYYAPGVYLTKGWQPGHPQTAHPNCYHIGSGIDKTIVRLDPSAVLEAGGNNEISIFSCDYNQRADGFEVWNMTLDGNANNNTQFKSGKGLITLIVCQGNNILIQGNKFMGWGTKSGECFTVFIQPSASAFSGTTFSHCHVQNCLFTLPATGNLDGTSICCVCADNSITAVDYQILNNQFINVTSDFTYSHAMCGLFQQGNLVNGCQTGFYLEPGSGSAAGMNNLAPIVIDSNTFINVPYVANLKYHPNGLVGPLAFSNNTVILPNRLGLYSVGVTLTGNTPTSIPAMTSVTLSGNQFIGENQLLTQQSYYRCFDLHGFGHNQVLGKLTLTGNRIDSNMASGIEFEVNGQEAPSLTASGNTYLNGGTVPVTYTTQ
jgi:hypothetical protein